jgi:hypothetical protein
MIEGEIDPASNKKMFAHLYTTKGAVGAGLGPWVSKQIVDKQKGIMRMRSSTPRASSRNSLQRIF